MEYAFSRDEEGWVEALVEVDCRCQVIERWDFRLDVVLVLSAAAVAMKNFLLSFHVSPQSVTEYVVSSVAISSQMSAGA